MKNIILILSVMLLPSTVLLAQFNFSSDTTFLYLEANVKKEVSIIIYNGSEEPFEMKWTETFRDLNASWSVDWCDCITCYSEYPENFSVGNSVNCSGVYALPAKSRFQGFILKINPKDSITDGFFEVEFEELADPTNNGKMLFYAKKTLSTNQPNDLVRAFSVYPTVAKEFVHVTYNLKQGVLARLSVKDMLGREVFTSSMSKDVNLKIINISHLKTGNYLISLESNKGQQISTKRFIKK